MITLYDVCNDYTLCNDVNEKGIAEAKTRAYRWTIVEGINFNVKLGYHRKTGELHYAKSDNKNLTGYNVFSLDSNSGAL